MLVLDADGRRIAVKYFSPEWNSVQAQANYEKTVWNKTSRTNARGEGVAPAGSPGTVARQCGVGRGVARAPAPAPNN
jgi:hypothetical protein